MTSIQPRMSATKFRCEGTTITQDEQGDYYCGL